MIPTKKERNPKVFGDEHYIEANTDIEYTLHFQNTGTDTAFNVVLLDTLSYMLNRYSLRPGASSHPYEFAMRDFNVAQFTFPNIMLPDSNVNEPGSHGYIKFRISQVKDLPVGTEINNDVAIYFDFNDPVITNETTHLIGEDFIEIVLTNINDQYPGLDISISPNPFNEQAVFQIKGFPAEQINFHLYDGQGKQVLQESFRGSQWTFHRNGLSSGLYFYTIESGGTPLGTGKVIVR